MRGHSKRQRAELEPLLRRLGALDIPEWFEGLGFDEAEWILADLTYPQFRKVDGAWAVIGQIDTVTPGLVLVHKRNGSSSTVRISRTGQPFMHMGHKMVHGFMR